MNDNFGDRMKLYEMSEAGRKLLPLLPVIARLDGRAFHGFVRGLERPYDQRLSHLMIETTKHLVRETNACCGYTQSDEITLAWYEADFASQLLFDGRVSKMTSILAALCSVYFNKRLPDLLPSEYARKMPIFDCRVWCVPNVTEGANAFLWREHDATKNSISMAARHYYSHNQLENKSGPEMQELLWRKGVNWNDYPVFFKRGTYVQRKNVIRPFRRGRPGKAAGQARCPSRSKPHGGANGVRGPRHAAVRQGHQPRRGDFFRRRASGSDGRARRRKKGIARVPGSNNRLESRMTTELVLFIGLQASGKSSFYRAHFAESHELVSKDRFPNNRNPRRRQRQLVAEALGAGRSVVIDNTNPTVEERAELIALAREFGAQRDRVLLRVLPGGVP